MHVYTVVKLFPLGTVDDQMHNCTRPLALCNSASGRQPHLRVIVLTILQTGMKITVYYKLYSEVNQYRYWLEINIINWSKVSCIQLRSNQIHLPVKVQYIK